MTTYNILLLPGDGIGAEVAQQAQRVLDVIGHHRGITFNVETELVGGVCYDVHRVAVTDATMDLAKRADAVLFGAVGGPAYDDVPRECRPEAAILRLRKDLDLYANLRPALGFDALLNASSLKPEVIAGLDLMIVRETTSGVYFGEPRGMTPHPSGDDYCIDTQGYTRSEIERVGRVAFELARQRGNRVTSVEKNNVMETGVFWKRVISQLHSDYSDVTLDHMLADNCAMQLIRNPKQFDVLLTDNLFGDLLSDAAAMGTGSLGMLPSATLGDIRDTGFRSSMYEPVHGSAPDIAGQDKANPCAMILSLAMMLKYSFGMNHVAAHVDQSVQAVLTDNIRTGDIAEAGSTIVGTRGMGDAICDKLNAILS